MSMPRASSDRGDPAGRALWFGLLGGAAAWAVQFLTGYFIAEGVCVAGGDAGAATVAVVLVSLVMLLVALAATLTGRRVWLRWKDARPGGSGWAGLAGMLLSGVFAFIIVVQVLPVFVGGGCT